MHLAGPLANQGLLKILKDTEHHKWSGSLQIRYQNEALKHCRGVLMFLEGRLCTCEEEDRSEKLGDDLITLDVLAPNQLQEALMICKKNDLRLEIVLFNEKFVDEESLNTAYEKILIKRLKKYINLSKGSYSFKSVKNRNTDLILPQFSLNNDDLFYMRGVSISSVLADFSASDTSTLEELSGTLGPTPGTETDYIDLSKELGFGQLHLNDIDESEINYLNSMIHELQDPKNISDLTLLLLRYGSHVFKRGVLLKIEGDELRSIGEFGFQFEGSDRELKFRQKRFPVVSSSVFSKALQLKSLLKEPIHPTQGDLVFFEMLGAKLPKEIFIAPILSRDKPQALLYGDFGPLSVLRSKTQAIEIFLSQVGLALEKKFLQERLEELEEMRP